MKKKWNRIAKNCRAITKGCNVCIMGIPGKEERETEETVEVIMTENF